MERRDFFGLFLCRLVPRAGLEPARPTGQQILSLYRLPIPTSRHFVIYLYVLESGPGRA